MKEKAQTEKLPGELLTLAEVAKILKVSRKTLYTWKEQGKIRFVKIGGRLNRVFKNELTELITPGDGADGAGSRRG